MFYKKGQCCGPNARLAIKEIVFSCEMREQRFFVAQKNGESMKIVRI
jgi:hypothetical protein